MAVAKSLASCPRCQADLPAAGADCPNCGKDPKAHDVVAGKYRLEKLIGRGGMGTVHLATDLSLDRPCAVKMLRASLASEEEIVVRFEKEARMLARLEHPNVVPIYAVDRDKNVPFIVMKYLEGRTLSQLRRDMGRPWAASELTPLVRQLCAGLGFMHSKGVVHRDLKPGNLFVSPEGHVTILDLGIARDLDSTLTRPGLPMGTPHYMSPEQTATTKIDSRSDLYSLGVILFEAVTGRLPFLGESEFDLMRAHRETPPPDASTLAQVAPLMGKLLQRAMAKEPRERYQSAKELADAWEIGAAAALPDASALAATLTSPSSPPAATPAPGAVLNATPSSKAPVAGVSRSTPLSKPPRPLPEAAKADAPKPEGAKPEVAKAEAPKSEVSKPDGAKLEGPRSEAAKVEPAKPEPAKPEVSKPDAAKVDAPKPEAPKPEAPKEVSKPDGLKLEAPKSDAPKLDAARPASMKNDAAKTDPTKADPTMAEAAKPDPSKPPAAAISDLGPRTSDLPPETDPSARALPEPGETLADPTDPEALKPEHFGQKPTTAMRPPAGLKKEPVLSKPPTPIARAMDPAKLPPAVEPEAGTGNSATQLRPPSSGGSNTGSRLRPPGVSAPGAPHSTSSGTGSRLRPPSVSAPGGAVSKPPSPIPSGSTPGSRLKAPAVAAPPAPKPGPPVTDSDPLTPVPAGQPRFPQPQGAQLGDEDPNEKTAMVQSPANLPSFKSLLAVPPRPSEPSASDTLSGDDEPEPPSERTNIVSVDSITGLPSQTIDPLGAAPAPTLASGEAALPVGPAGTVEPTSSTGTPWSPGEATLASGEAMRPPEPNPWGTENTASSPGRDASEPTVTPSDDFARRPTTESPIAQLTTVLKRPLVLMVGGGVFFLALVLTLVLAFRSSPSEGDGSIVEVTPPPKPWKNDVPLPPPPQPPQQKQEPQPQQKEEPPPPPPPEPEQQQAGAEPQKPAPQPAGETKPRKARAGKGELRVVTMLKGKSVVASVFVDGVDKGHSPLVVQLPAGKHDVKVTRGSGPGVSRSVRVSADKSAVLKIDLPE